jgi:hydroxymethylbilane synthase
MARRRIVIATRESTLALWQANFIRERLLEVYPDLSIELLGMTTQGDRWQSSPLSEVGGKGLFIKELEEAILKGTADIAVHSMKDVPAQLPAPFALPVIGYRADVRDALVCPQGHGLMALPAGARVGSSSLRRQAMLLAQRGDLKMLPVRGNVGTRLGKLDAGEYDALILAAAGLERLGLAERICEHLAIDVCLPAAGQAALGIECAAADEELLTMLEALNDPAVSDCVRAERMVSATLGADCSTPLGAYACKQADRIELTAVLCTADGSRILRAAATGTDPLATGREVASSLLNDGAAELLADLASSAAGDDG